MNWNVNSQDEMKKALEGYFSTITLQQAGQFNAMLSPQLRSCSYEGRSVVISMEVQPWMVNPAGLLHGGIGSAILDFTMGLLSRIMTGGSLTPTVSLDVEYLRSAHAGDTVLVEAVCNKAGRSLSYVTASAWLEGTRDKLIMTASASYYTGGSRG